MNRRSQDREPNFGSDSFLDIIANIVGILIILIVVAGVKVSRQPVKQPAAHSSPGVKSPEIAVRSTEDPIPTVVLPKLESEPMSVRTVDEPWEADYQPWVAVKEMADPQPEIEPPEPVRLQPSPELLKRRDELSRLVASVTTQFADAQRKQSSLTDQVTSRDRQIATIDDELSKKTDQLKQTEQIIEESERRLNADLLRLATLKRQLKTAQEPRTRVETIRHRLNPVSREVSENEVHFRLSNERLSIVPLTELLDETMRQIRRRSDSLMRFNRHTGRVGPIGGYVMNYSVERRSLTVLEKLRESGGYVRIDVTQSTLEPTDSLREMTVDEALRPGSEFSSRLHRVGADASLTFWVYPDSFESFRTIQSVLHDLGFAVAARPLPHGTPIGVSPTGTRSNAQ